MCGECLHAEKCFWEEKAKRAKKTFQKEAKKHAFLGGERRANEQWHLVHCVVSTFQFENIIALKLSSMAGDSATH